MDDDDIVVVEPGRPEIVQIAECVAQLALIFESLEQPTSRRFLKKTLDALTYYIDPPRGEVVVLERTER